MKPIIEVNKLSKEFRLGAKRASYGTLRDKLEDVARAPWNFLRRSTRAEAVVWALREVSFDVRPGEVVGVIGRNGAGKSTLLKVLSRITEPTLGEVNLYGRVSSLLEVGTGFHPELTGRENVFLNGAILGMRRDEIRRKFDEIAAFAEIEKFLDTPVKHYSSGMYMRLAFAVAAHLEPEILIIDEVLAVGDAAFQRKCLGKMEDVGRDGRTILFVSHQLSAISRICTRVIMLNAGRIEVDGRPKETLSHYTSALSSVSSTTDLAGIPRAGTGDLRITGFYVEDSRGARVSSVASGEDIQLVFEYASRAQRPLVGVSVGFSLHTSLGETLTVFYSAYAGRSFAISPGNGRLKCVIKRFPFSAGAYFVGARVIAGNTELDWPRDYVGTIEVTGGDFYGLGGAVHEFTDISLLTGEWMLEQGLEEVSVAGD